MRATLPAAARDARRPCLIYSLCALLLESGEKAALSAGCLADLFLFRSGCRDLNLCSFSLSRLLDACGRVVPVGGVRTQFMGDFFILFSRLV